MSTRNDDTYFGVCPECRKTHGYLNVKAEHWFVCHTHRVKWLIGSNLFSSWQDESVVAWFQNELVLMDYLEVEPAQ